MMVTAYIQTITILYKYFCVWELDFRLNNINLHQLFLLILLITYYHYFLILNLWNTIKFKHHNQWVAHLWYWRLQSIYQFLNTTRKCLKHLNIQVVLLLHNCERNCLCTKFKCKPYRVYFLNPIKSCSISQANTIISYGQTSLSTTYLTDTALLWVLLL